MPNANSSTPSQKITSAQNLQCPPENYHLIIKKQINVSTRPRIYIIDTVQKQLGIFMTVIGGKCNTDSLKTD